MVSIIPEVDDQERLTPAALNALGSPEGRETARKIGEAVEGVKIGGSS